MNDSKGGCANTSGWWRVRILVDQQPLSKDSLLPLTSAQVHYLIDVLRQRSGAVVYAFDGKGAEVKTSLVKQGRNSYFLECHGPSEYVGADAAFKIHVGQGKVTRNRMDYAIEKMTEAGVAAITPIANWGCKRTDRFGDVGPRWNRVAAAAATQCGRMHVPEIGAVSSVAEWNAALPSDCQKFLLSPQAERLFSRAAAQTDPKASAAVLIGRTAGLDGDEEEVAIGLGFKPVGLGERVLRCETAGVVAATVLLAAVGEL